MSYRGKIIKFSRYQDCPPRDYICTAHFAGHVEVVSATPGQEGCVYPLISLKGSALSGAVLDSWDDPSLIAEVKTRCRQCIDDALNNRDRDEEMLEYLERLHTNLIRLQSLDGDCPAAVLEPVPEMKRQAALDRVFADFFTGDFDVFAGIHDEALLIPENDTPLVESYPDYIGKLVFIEVPLEFDGIGGSGEYIIVEQSDDSLYGVKTTCCKAGIEVVRIPFEHKGHTITVLDAYDDDNFVKEFIERLDDMDTENYEPLECDLAETAMRQLSRMLEQKLLDRAKSLNDPLLRLFKATDTLFNTLGTASGRMNGQAEDRISRTECSGCAI